MYPWLGWQRVEDDYREMSELNDMGRTEDISLGFNLFGSVGFAKESYGSDRDATLYRVALEKGWEPGGPGRLFVLEGGGSTRDEDVGYRNSQVYFAGHYYRRNLGKHLFSVSFVALATNNLDPENQVLLGGDNGLRGYPIRYQAGEERVVLNVEQRFFTDWYPWRLLRVGWAVFADAGRVYGQDPRATPSFGLLRDVGIGLRLSSPRASGNRVVHVDLAFPLDGDESIDSVQFVVETKRSFDALERLAVDVVHARKRFQAVRPLRDVRPAVRVVTRYLQHRDRAEARDVCDRRPRPREPVVLREVRIHDLEYVIAPRVDLFVRQLDRVRAPNLRALHPRPLMHLVRGLREPLRDLRLALGIRG